MSTNIQLNTNTTNYSNNTICSTYNKFYELYLTNFDDELRDLNFKMAQIVII